MDAVNLPGTGSHHPEIAVRVMFPKAVQVPLELRDLSAITEEITVPGGFVPEGFRIRQFFPGVHRFVAQEAVKDNDDARGTPAGHDEQEQVSELPLAQ